MGKTALLLFIPLIFLALIVYIIIPFLPLAPHLNSLLGFSRPHSYLILLANDAEMRANGGFVGSYATLTISKAKITSLNFEDIYVPNGQLKGYVVPPEPIEEAFKLGTWQLANSDWDPHFPSSANTTRWFMEKGGEPQVDTLVLINLTTIKNITKIVGSLQVPEYQAQISPENLYQFLQTKAELNFFPGSTQKKDALTALGNAFSAKLISLPLHQKIAIAQLVLKDLRQQNLLLHSKDQTLEQFFLKQNYAGALEIPNTTDYFLLVETNLGANKANAYITRQTEHRISKTPSSITHQTTLTLHNASPENNPNPPLHYGGSYIAYLRVYIPPEAQNITLKAQETPISPQTNLKNGFLELGFWHTTPSQNTSTVTISYTLPQTSKYSLTLLKQHSLPTSPQTIITPQKTIHTSLENDRSFDLL